MKDDETDRIWQKLTSTECMALAGQIPTEWISPKTLARDKRLLKRVVKEGDRYALVLLCDMAIRHMYHHDHATFERDKDD